MERIVRQHGRHAAPRTAPLVGESASEGVTGTEKLLSIQLLYGATNAGTGWEQMGRHSFECAFGSN